MRLLCVTPHFAPDVAPTGVVISRIVEELARRGHSIEVVTSFPWYRDHRIEPGYEGAIVRHEDTPWGRVTRLHPFPAPDKRHIVRRAVSFAGFSSLAAILGARGGAVDGVLAVSPPLTLGLTGVAIARARKAPLVFNLQDVFPDVAIELGVVSNPTFIKAIRRLEAFTYARADAITVLSTDLRANIEPRVDSAAKIRVIPNFVDTETVRPLDRDNPYRREFGLDGKTVVMYAGNVGLSQSLHLLLEAAAALSYEEDLVFVINGQGAQRDELERSARGLSNVRFVDLQPVERLPEVLAAGDIHVVPLKRGLARASVPSKTYSILAAGRPIVASVDPGSEVARIVEEAAAGVAVPPEDAEALTKAIRSLVESPATAREMGEKGRAFVERWASPAAVAGAYEELFVELRELRSQPSR